MSILHRGYETVLQGGFIRRSRSSSESNSLVVHVLIPAFSGGHEGKHDQGRPQSRIILVPSLRAFPLGESERLQEKDTEKYEQYEPKRQQTKNHGKTGTVDENDT